MNKSELHKNIIKDIQEIYSFVNRFENPNQVHQIDIDLALSKVRNLYDLLLKLNSQETYTAEYQKEEKSTINKPSEDLNFKRTQEKTPEIDTKKTNKPEIEPTYEFVDEKVPLLFEDKKDSFQEKEVLQTPIKKEEKQKKITKKADKGAHSEIVADKFHSKTFMNETISIGKTEKKDVSSKMKSKPISDINSAIGLNDKFVFIRELFKGDKDQYSETIQLLNNFDTFENAIGFLRESFKWDFNDPNVEKLIELARRKYNE